MPVAHRCSSQRSVLDSEPAGGRNRAPMEEPRGSQRALRSVGGLDRRAARNPRFAASISLWGKERLAPVTFRERRDRRDREGRDEGKGGGANSECGATNRGRSHLVPPYRSCGCRKRL